MKTPKIVRVKWVDSNAHIGWGRQIGAYEDDDIMCESAGYLVRNDRQTIVIAASTTDFGNDTEFNNCMVIPRSAIRGRIEVLKK